MIFNTCLFIFINTCFYTIYALPYARHRRQIRPIKESDLPYEGWGGGSSNPSGGIPGVYYGSGHNPNYGNIQPVRNDADSSMHVLNYYNHNSGTGIHESVNNAYQQQLLQQPNYLNINNNNRWQGTNTNMNNNYNRPYNRYPPGSQGWYATGGNYWYNKGQSLTSYTFVLILSVLFSIIHMY